MFYLTRNFGRQKVRLQKAKKKITVPMPMPTSMPMLMPSCRCRDFQMTKTNKIKKGKSRTIYFVLFLLKFVRMKKFL